MKIYHGWVLKAKIGFKWPIFRLFDIELAFEIPETFWALETLQRTLVHSSYGIFHEKGHRWVLEAKIWL